MPSNAPKQDTPNAAPEAIFPSGSLSTLHPWKNPCLQPIVHPPYVMAMTGKPTDVAVTLILGRA
jgi:hypothetical protein